MALRYKLTVGNEYIESRLLTAAELNTTIEALRDAFDDRLYIMSITVHGDA